jgi:hypothetical protein
MSVHIFGIRHHGPGSARSLRAALEELRPDCLLVEGPPDASATLPLLMHEQMEPPVALLLYVPERPSRAVFYPFTHFSPEWQALRYAFGQRIPARFMDLPQAIQLAREPETNGPGEEAEPEAPTDLPDLPQAADSGQPHTRASTRKAASSASVSSMPTSVSSVLNTSASARRSAVQVEAPPQVRDDPLAMLAEAAGYSDHELWWEREIEQRRDATGLFEGILEAMTALRADLTPRDPEEAQREAHMRQTIRAAEQEGFARIAVICGAWHSPALVARDEFPHDAETLAGLARVKVEATWIPWTNSRLAYRSGYGAGVTSPGWYTHLWSAPDRGTIRWVAHAAQLLRDEGLDASSASVIEAVRLSEALAAMRDLPMPGMAELHEAIQTVLCHGEESPMRLIRDRLEIGELMGTVPAETPAVPLQRDLDLQRRRISLTDGDIKRIQERRNLTVADPLALDLDLRQDTDRARSQLLNRLRLLEVEWGKPRRIAGNKQGDFHESWTVTWEPEFAVKLIEANVYGNTVEAASGASASRAADAADELPVVTSLLQRVLPAGLPDTAEHIMARVQTLAAVSADVRLLMDALPQLAHVARYPDLRYGTAGAEMSARARPVFDGIFERAVIGLPGACASLDEDAAAKMVESVGHVDESVRLLNRDDQRAAWLATLRKLADRETIHGLVRGRCCRLLLEAGAMEETELQRQAGLALSPVVPADQAAAWVQGVLRGPGLILLHQDGLWRALDAWLSELPQEAFVALLPMLRRAFSDFHGPERRAMGEKVKHLRTAGAGTSALPAGEGADLSAVNAERARLVLPVLAEILGVPYGSGE